MYCIHLIFFALVCLSWHVAAQAEEGAEADEPTQAEGAPSEDTPEQLFETGNCPTDPKLECSDPSCKGSLCIPGRFEQFTCTNRSPAMILGRPAVAFRCWCCPLRLEVTCTDSLCDAPPDSRICQGETLRGCPCITNEERAAEAVSTLDVGGSPPPGVPRLAPMLTTTSLENIHALMRQLHDMGQRNANGESALESLYRAAGRPMPPGGNETAVPNETVAQAETGEIASGNGTDGEASDRPQSAGDGVSSASGRLPTSVGYIQYDFRKM